MPEAKEILLRPISRQIADDFIRRNHYSGKVVTNAQLHVGVYLHGTLEGAMQFGPPLDKSKVLGLVRDTPWNGMLELNRMAFSATLPRNSESRALAVAMRMLRKHLPQTQWVLTFADATQCGDGTIYRAAGFILTSIRESVNLMRLPNGTIIHKLTLHSSPMSPRPELGGRSYYDITGGKYNTKKYLEVTGGTIVPGFQIRYIYPLDPTVPGRLASPPLPYSAIAEAGAAMYLGKRIART